MTTLDGFSLGKQLDPANYRIEPGTNPHLREKDDEWAKPRRAEVDALPDGDQKRKLEKMLDKHAGKGWTTAEEEDFNWRLEHAKKDEIK